MSESLLAASAGPVAAEDNPKCVAVTDWRSTTVAVAHLRQEGTPGPANDQPGEIDCIHRTHVITSAALLVAILITRNARDGMIMM
jgi:hypothetical protein